MKTIGVNVLLLVVVMAAYGCRQRQPEPLPGPKAGVLGGHFHPASIALIQGSLEEAFASAPHPRLAANSPDPADADSSGTMDAPQTERPAAGVRALPVPGENPAAPALNPAGCPNSREHS